MKIKTKILVWLLVIMLCMLGLINNIDNDILKVIYATSMLLLGNTIRKRLGIEVR